MAARSTMADLIGRVRLMIDDDWVLRQDSALGDGSNAVFWLNYKPLKETGGTVSVGGTAQGTATWTLDRTHGRLSMTSAPADGATVAVEYEAAVFTDDRIEDALDGHRVDLFEEELIPVSTRDPGGTAIWKRYYVPGGWADLETTDGGTAVFIVEDASGSVISSGYSVDYIRGAVDFTNSTGGSARYVTARSYDLFGAAAELCREWASKMTRSYTFSDGRSRYERGQMVAALREQAAEFERKAWPVQVRMQREDESDA